VGKKEKLRIWAALPLRDMVDWSLGPKVRKERKQGRSDTSIRWEWVYIKKFSGWKRRKEGGPEEKEKSGRGRSCQNKDLHRGEGDEYLLYEKGLREMRPLILSI